MSGCENPIYAPTFGRSLDEWRACALCVAPAWRVLNSLWCKEHGGQSPAPEWRYSVWGKYEERAGYVAPAGVKP